MSRFAPRRGWRRPVYRSIFEVVSQRIAWPLTGDTQFQADDLKLKLSGKMTDYTLSMRTAVKGQDIPPATITLDAKGNERQINLDKLTVAALEEKPN